MRRKRMKDKYSEMNDIAAFGFMVNALGGGGDRGQSFPRSDAEDLSRGLRFIPGEVTLARRDGQRVPFMQPCDSPCCWYWQFEDGSRTYYWTQERYKQIAKHNGAKEDAEGRYVAGPCPDCGNIHTNGGHIEAEALK
jgi:hypothetical protein